MYICTFIKQNTPLSFINKQKGISNRKKLNSSLTIIEKNKKSSCIPMAPNDNSTSLNIPEWVQENLFIDILKKDIPQFSEITKYCPVEANPPGEGYASTMLRVHIDVLLKDGNTASVSYIVKTAIESKEYRDLVDSLNSFPKEKDIYENILPAFEQMYAEAGKSVRFGPSCKFIKDTPEHITIIMEDLKVRNFSNVNRLEGLDLQHLTKALHKLAEFHAASAVYHERFGPLSDVSTNSYNAEKHREAFKLFGSGMYKTFIDVFPKWGDCEKYVKIWPDGDKIFDWILKATEADPTEFNVLNHGDCWSNNIMFQHNTEGEVTDTYLVDYQLTQWGSPAQDFIIILTASGHYDLCVREFDRLVKIYYDHLADCLSLLKYTKAIPNLKDIHIQLIKYSVWGLFAATSILPMILSDSSDSAKMDDLMASEKIQEQVLTNPRFVRVMKQFLPWWENRGLFQF